MLLKHEIFGANWRMFVKIINHLVFVCESCIFDWTHSSTLEDFDQLFMVLVIRLFSHVYTPPMTEMFCFFLMCGIIFWHVGADVIHKTDLFLSGLCSTFIRSFLDHRDTTKPLSLCRIWAPSCCIVCVSWTESFSLQLLLINWSLVVFPAEASV